MTFLIEQARHIFVKTGYPISLNPNSRDKSMPDPYAPKTICAALQKKDLITPAQTQQVLNKYDQAYETLAKRRQAKTKKAGGPNRIARPLTPIDVIVAMKLARKGKTDIILDEDAVYEALAAHWKIPFKKIDPLKLDLNLVTTTIPRSFAMRHLVLPIAIKNDCLTVATPEPFNAEVMDDIARASLMKVDQVVSPKTDIIRLIDEFFGFKSSIAAAENQFERPLVDLGNLEQYVRLKAIDELPSNDQHIVNAVNHLFSYAFDQRASDVHIEPKREVSRVRMRIDGILHTVYELPKSVHSAIVSRIKALSRLDMAEKRKPQDGRIKTSREDTEVEIRVSTVATAFGEKVVMRLMDPDILFQDLENLGFTDTDLIRYNQFINKPYGLILVCGPTGSGKSTTLYSSLRNLSTSENNITTIEDPVEMIHEDFNQIAIQPAAGITFGNIMRNILRQDPDIIMLGEMRDLETAQNAIQAAMTGHLVLSTLHTNNAPAAVTRLLDLGVPYFLIQTSLVGVLAQRLVRKICAFCKEDFQIEAEELRDLGLTIDQNGLLTLSRGQGCRRCRGTGYLGRSAILEVLPYTDAIKKLTRPDADLGAIQEAARKEGLVTLRENGIKKFLKGETTYQEVLRVT